MHLVSLMALLMGLALGQGPRPWWEQSNGYEFKDFQEFKDKMVKKDGEF